MDLQNNSCLAGTPNRIKGKFGELIAEKYLIKKNYELLQKNWTCHWGELDLIAKKGCKYIFVEVKYRTSLRYGDGSASISKSKCKHLFRSIQRYLLQNNLHNCAWQVDVITIINSGEKRQLRHFEAVPLW